MQRISNSNTVFLNGKFVAAQEAKFSVTSPGLLHGFGLFETMRSYQRRIIYLDGHLRRLKASCKIIGIALPYSSGQLKAIIKRTVALNGYADAYVRLTLWKSDPADILILVREYKPYHSRKYQKGFCACVSKMKQNENYFLAQIKSTNYLFFMLAYQEAKERRCDEAIILNQRGYIAEASRSNIFLVKERVLYTPSLECGCLPGITKSVVLSLAKKYNTGVYAAKFTLPDLFGADEAFLTNSLMGIMPLTRVEGRRIKDGRAGKITRFFMRKYNSLLKDA